MGGGCEMIVCGPSASCNPTESNPCRDCGFILGLTVPTSQAVALDADLGLLGRHFLDQLPGGLDETAHDLARLDYPLADRLALHDQLKVRGLESRSRALLRIVFPVLSLADALDKLFEGISGNLMRWAVGDYEPTTIRNLASALSAGAIKRDGSSRELKVLTMARPQGVVVDVDCHCARPSGSCELTLGGGPDVGVIYCSGCSRCEMEVKIPSGLLAS